MTTIRTIHLLWNLSSATLAVLAMVCAVQAVHGGSRYVATAVFLAVIAAWMIVTKASASAPLDDNA